MTLTEFLEREIAADEAVARRAQRAYQHVFGIPHYFTANSDTSVAMNPRVALAECEAKRRILALHTPDHECPMFPGSEPAVQLFIGEEVCDTLYALAQPYADRPGFDPAWRLDP